MSGVPLRAANILVRAGEKAAAKRLLASLDEFPRVPKTIAARHRLLGELYLGEDDASLAVNTFESNATRAVNAFDQGLAGARWTESRLPLIRALIRAGDVSRARRELAMVVEHPVAIYAGPEPQAPGLWREAIVQYTTLVAQRDPDEAEKLSQRFARILRAKTTIAAPTAQSPR